MQSFEDFYSELTEDDIWFDRMQMIHRGKDVREAAMLVWGEMSSDPEKHRFQSVQETRKWINNKLVYLKPKPVKVIQNYQQPQAEPEVHQPMTDEIWNLLEQYKQQIKQTAKPVPKLSPKEIQEQGQARPPALNGLATGYQLSYAEMEKQAREHDERLRQLRWKCLRERHPEWTPKEVLKELKKMEKKK